MADAAYLLLMLVAAAACTSPAHRRAAMLVLANGAVGAWLVVLFDGSIRSGYAFAVNDVLFGLLVIYCFREGVDSPVTSCGVGVVQGLFAPAHTTMTLSVVVKNPTIFYTQYENFLTALQVSTAILFYGGVKYVWTNRVGFGHPRGSANTG